MTLSRRIAEGIGQVVDAGIDDADMAAARRCLLDSLACLLAGSGTEEVARLSGALGADAGGVLGHASADARHDDLLAAATAIRTLDFNDSFSGRNNMHPSELVIPILLSEAARQGWGGDRLLREVVTGYRVCLGVSELWEGLLACGWAPTATLGQIVSAAVRSAALRLPTSVTATALSMAGATSGTLAVVFRGQQSDLKNMINGIAAVAGWRACELARAGLTAPHDALDGTSGFAEMVAGDADADALDRWPMLGPQDMWLKAYPAVFHSHSAIEGALEIARRAGGRTPGQVVVTVSQKVAAVTAQPFRWTVDTGAQGQFSLPYCVGVALADGTFGLDQIADTRVAAADVPAMLARLAVHTTDEFDTYSQARVDVAFDDGADEAAQVSVPYGHSNRPISRADLEAKVRDLARWADHEPLAEPLINVVLDGEPSLAALRGVLSGVGTSHRHAVATS